VTAALLLVVLATAGFPALPLYRTSLLRMVSPLGVKAVLDTGRPPAEHGSVEPVGVAASRISDPRRGGAAFLAQGANLMGSPSPVNPVDREVSGRDAHKR
jgi:hypothetical protein